MLSSIEIGRPIRGNGLHVRLVHQPGTDSRSRASRAVSDRLDPHAAAFNRAAGQFGLPDSGDPPLEIDLGGSERGVLFGLGEPDPGAVVGQIHAAMPVLLKLALARKAVYVDIRFGPIRPDAPDERAGRTGVARRGAAKRVSRADTAPVETAPISPLIMAHAVGLGLELANWRYGRLNWPAAALPRLRISLQNPTLESACREGLGLARSVNYARELAASPPNIATPSALADAARKLAREHAALQCRVLRGATLRAAGCVGLETVGRASADAPCMIVLRYEPPARSAAAATGKEPVCVVGKTLCYDTGGLSIKPRESMTGMKYDKCGGTAVLGFMQWLAESGMGTPVVALLPCAENSVSAAAVRPDDIIRYPNGLSVEITNTDAEGRLVLADALLYAAGRVKPRCIVDLATLTGGVLVALGRHRAGYFSNDEALAGKIEAAAQGSGERVWRLPMDDAYMAMMKSPHADMVNSAAGREAHPIQGAVFLKQFVPAEIPWAHIDIAGVATTRTDLGPIVPGPTGFGVRLLASLIESI